MPDLTLTISHPSGSFETLTLASRANVIDFTAAFLKNCPNQTKIPSDEDRAKHGLEGPITDLAWMLRQAAAPLLRCAADGDRDIEIEALGEKRTDWTT